MKKRKEKCEGLLVPESVCGEIALTATSGFQFDKSPTRWIKGAHEGDAHTQYYKPVADNDACKEYWIIIPNQTWQTPQELHLRIISCFTYFIFHSPKARFLAVTSEHGW